MRFSLYSSIFLLATFTATVTHAEPSRTFFTETNGIASQDSVSVDLEYGFDNDASCTGVRLGKFGGEVLLNITNSEFAASSIGYKRQMEPNMSLYGSVSHLNDDDLDDSFTDIALGVAYTIPLEGLKINLNGEFITDDSETLRGGDNTLFVKGALILPLNIDDSPASLIAELVAENNDALDSGAALGVRWIPVPQLTTDFVFYLDNGVDDATGIPGYIKLNYQF